MENQGKYRNISKLNMNLNTFRNKNIHTVTSMKTSMINIETFQREILIIKSI